MKVKINKRFDKGYVEIVIEENRRLFNFETHRWEDIEPNVAYEPVYILGLPDEIFVEIAKKIKTMDDIPDKTKSFNEGKIESLEKHLEDMRKLAFKKDKK